MGVLLKEATVSVAVLSSVWSLGCIYVPQSFFYIIARDSSHRLTRCHYYCTYFEHSYVPKYGK